MMYVVSMGLMIGLALSLTGCSQAIPTTTTLGLSIKSPTFGGSNTRTLIIPTYNSSLIVSGECDSQTQTLASSTDSGTTWSALAYAGDLNCADGTFSFTIPDCSTLGLSSGSAPGTRVSIQLRSETSSANSNASTFHIQLNSAYNIKFADVGGSGGKITSPNYKIQNKIATVKSTAVLSSANYKVHLQGSEP